ncbi:MAG: cobalt ECF transporter T component CbiQ [bacterium]|nr:cobalt ECF transporter T component CbiQ [bacterium]
MRPDIDRYWELKSPIHSWDPRLRILTLLILAFSISSAQRLPTILGCLLFSFLLLWLTKIPLSFSLKRLAAVTTFIGPFFLIMPLTIKAKPGDTIYFFSHLKFLEINVRGLYLATRVYCKAVAIVLLVVPMFGTSRFDTSIKALEHLKVPNSIIQMILFSYRYVFVFLAELKRMSLAMKVRKFTPSTNFHTLKTYGNFIGTLLVRSFELAEEVYQAMLARGYTGRLKIQVNYRTKPGDWIKSALIFAAVLGIIYFDRFFRGF